MALNLGFSDKKEKSSQAQQTSGVKTESLAIEQEAIDKIISDVLGGAEGLAAIFSGEQTAGIFDSSVANQAAGDLAAKLAGEIAKITAEKRITTETEGTSSGTGKSSGFSAQFGGE